MPFIQSVLYVAGRGGVVMYPLCYPLPHLRLLVCSVDFDLRIKAIHQWVLVPGFPGLDCLPCTLSRYLVVH